MRKTNIKFFIIFMAVFGFIFFFAAESWAAGCCKYTATLAGVQKIQCEENITDEQTCKSKCLGITTDCTFFSNQACINVDGCPQGAPPTSPDRGCCLCETGRITELKYSCYHDLFYAQCFNKNIGDTSCSFKKGQSCREVPNCIPLTPTPPTPPPKYEYEPVYPSLQIPIPGIPSLTEFAKVEIRGEPGERYVYIPWVGQYISAIYNWAMGIVGVLAVVMIIWGGVIYLTAGGSPERISTAKSYITSAIAGLILAFGSYLLLYTINPDLVKFAALKIRVIEKEEYLLAEEDIEEQAKTLERVDLVSIEDIDNIVFDKTVEIKKLRPETAEALKIAAQKLKEQGVVLQLNNAARSYEKQLRLYNQYGKGRACFPKEEIGGYNCPHIVGIAVDAVCQGKTSDDPCQEKVKKAMFEAGFCRYTPEAWHFEYPKMSRNCVKE